MTTPECEHHDLRFVSIDDADRLGRRTVHLACRDCDQPVDILTTRSADEIQSEIEAQQ